MCRAKPFLRALVTAVVLASGAAHAEASHFEDLAGKCAPQVHVNTLKRVALVESGGNPFAIGVVAGHLKRQPKTLDEALATVNALEQQGYNFSMGLVQVNRYNLAKYGEAYETIFEPCRNLKVGAAILADCYARARVKRADEQDALHAALSCYYSGNFTAGVRLGYVQKILAASPAAPALARPIEVVPDVGANAVPAPTPKSTTTGGATNGAAKPAAPGGTAARRPAAAEWFQTFGEDEDDLQVSERPARQPQRAMPRAVSPGAM